MAGTARGRVVPHPGQPVRRGTRALQRRVGRGRAATGAGAPVHAGAVRRGRPGRRLRLRRAALPAPRLSAPGVWSAGHPGGRTRRRLRAVAGDVRVHGPAVASGVALRPRGRVRPGGLPAPPVQRRTPRGRWPVGFLPGAAARAPVHRPGHRHRPGQPPGAPGPADGPDGAGGAGRPDALRPQPLRPRAPRLAGPARGHDPVAGPGFDDRLQLSARAGPDRRPPRGRAGPGAGAWTPAHVRRRACRPGSASSW
ncbi:hypothetical protein SGPA1_50546 [Streptomyces misionensis JCM 4497]